MLGVDTLEASPSVKSPETVKREQTPIRFSDPAPLGNEHSYIAEAIRNGKLAADGPFTERCQSLLEAIVPTPRALLTTSCTDALEMSALLLNIGPSDEVIVPTFSFISTVNAFIVRGGRPIFADMRADTLNIDETQLEALITPRTKAIVIMNYAGIGCEMDAITAIARRHGLKIVEDHAHGPFGTYRGRPLGTFGDLATLSFHDTKNFTAGEGGALLVNDPSLIARAEMVRQKGTNRREFMLGQAKKYNWVDHGSSHAISDLLAAYLLAQLEQRELVVERRRDLWTFYERELRGWAAAHGVRLPIVPAHCEPTHHLFYLLLPSRQRRDAFIEYMRERKIATPFHYQPLHVSPMGLSLGGREGSCPVAETWCERLVRLPFHNVMDLAMRERVVEATTSFRP